jgi:predicted RNA-binding Zn ribbon-like protein
MSRIGPPEPTSAAFAGRRSITDLLWVANTSHGPGAHWHARPRPGDADHDHLRTPAEAVPYLVDHHLSVPDGPPTADQLASLAAIRDAVRSLADGPIEWRPDALELFSKARFSLTADGRLAAEGEGWDAFLSDLLIPLVELARTRERLSTCGNPACRLLFLDESRSHSRRWCDDGGCGNRARARAYRRSHADARGAATA